MRYVGRPSLIMPRSLSKQESIDFIFKCRNYPGPHTLLCCIMMYTGLRVSEVLKLRWSDLIYNNCVKSTIEILSINAKNNRSRSLPVSGDLHDRIVTRWRMAQENHRMKPHDFLAAPISKAPPISSRTLQRFTKEVGLISINRAVNPHMLRHTFATHLLAVSNLEIVRKALGHRRISTTQIYVHPSDDELRSAVNRKDLALEQLKN